MGIGAIITAAGRSSRMGSFKPLLKIGEFTVAEHVIHSYHTAGIKDIVMVTGHNAQELESRLTYLNLLFLRNDDYESNEMFDSVKIGLDYQKDKCAKILISPIDVPLFTADTVKALLKCNASVGIPTYKGKTGHPIILDSEAAEKILRYHGDGGLRGAITNLFLEIEYIETADQGMLYDMNTPFDYKKIVQLNNGK